MSCSDFPTKSDALRFKKNAGTINEIVTSKELLTSPAIDGKQKLTLKGLADKFIFRNVGEYSDNPLIQEFPQFVTDNGEIYFPTTYPYQVKASTYPNASDDPNLALAQSDNTSLVTASGTSVTKTLSDWEKENLLGPIAKANNVRLDKVAILQTGTVSGISYFYDVSTQKVFNSSAPITGGITSFTVKQDYADILLDGETIVLVTAEYLSNIKTIDFLIASDFVFPVGYKIGLQGWNSISDGGCCELICVQESEAFGIKNNGGSKFHFLSGMDQWKKHYSGGTPKLIAHRGAAGYTEKNLYFAPENSIYSARRASQAGYWGLEADGKITSDGHVVVFHDSTVDRVVKSGETGSISNYTLSEVKNMDAGSYVSNIYTNSRILTYNEWFATCKRYGLVPCPEISVRLSDAQAQQFIDDCEQYYPNCEGVFLQSTDIVTLRRVRDKNANITLYRSFSYGSVPAISGINEIYELGNSGVHYSGGALNNDISIVTEATKRGMCTSYAIANTQELVDLAESAGMHRIMTDFILIGE